MSDKLADKRLQKTYGITLAEYDAMLAEQGGVCKICQKPPGKFRLSVDHDHRFDRVKIKIYKMMRRFQASATNVVLNVNLLEVFSSRKIARIQMKQILRRLSIRGILCWRCNSGLRKYADRPERFEAAAKYLRDFENKTNQPTVSRKSRSTVPESCDGLVSSRSVV